ncbi:hypothetical protein DMC30DRAFT_260595 [Rhodotorula diobovata]|uniref:Uncharacterized protein n=1 Tax=Rhodotorula diobovata TaxID=5288 RepID=A0A5C5G7P3_9BASI|nr:hypothetical protein DMC30DRAFT_260595 [Rhodotorula diobovata]
MPLRRARPSSTSESARAAKRLAAIDAAFDRAAGYDPARYADEDDRASATRARKAVVPDDEEDGKEDVEMELVTGTGNGEGESAAEVADVSQEEAGGFLREPPGGDHFGGGFLVGDEQAAGGFLLEPPMGGGGFLPEPEKDAPTGAGFMPEPSTSDVGAGGGFLLPDPSATTPTPAASTSFAEGGGFLSPSPDAFGGGGFLLDDPFPSLGDISLPTPAPLTHRLPTPPPPPSRIPLARIPAALRDLGLHRVGLAGAELIGLFDEVASEDEDDPMGGRSVRRERFREACEVLLGDENLPSSAGEEEGAGERPEGVRAEGEEDDLELGEGRRRRRQPSRRQPVRRSTRGHPDGGEVGDGDEDGDEVVAKDFGDALPDDEDASSPSFASESDDDEEEEEEDDDVPAKGKKGSTKNGTKARRGAKGDPSRPLSKQDLADAADSFDLFFDESPQLAFGQGKRAITLMELQRACRVLKEKMSDGELNEMLEYAAKSKGVVDLEAFARILLETGL